MIGSLLRAKQDFCFFHVFYFMDKKTIFDFAVFTMKNTVAG